MSQNQVDWDQEIPHNPEEEYQALLRALRRKRGFGLYFVQCSPQKGNETIANLRKDLPQKNMQVLQLDRATTTLYDRVEALWQQQPFEILFIQGLENALYEYEDTKRMAGWSSGEIYSYSWKGVPRILNHLNQQRERFRDNFHCVFIFLVPLFVIKYFIQRAPDFFDWRSGLFSFPDLSEQVEQIFSRILESRDYDDYVQLTPAQRNEKLLHLSEVFSQTNLKPDDLAELWREKGRLLHAANDYQAALSCYQQALYCKPDYDAAWYNRGNALSTLGRKEEAIDSYDKAIEFKPDYHQAWNNRGVALSDLGRKEEAIESYEKAIEYKPDYYRAWDNRGDVLADLQRYEAAVVSYDKAIEINPEYRFPWKSRGVALMRLGQFDEAITSFDQAIALKVDYEAAWYDKACCYGLQGDVEKAVETLVHAIELHPENRELAKTDSDFDNIRSDDRFRALVEGSGNDQS